MSVLIIFMNLLAIICFGFGLFNALGVYVHNKNAVKQMTQSLIDNQRLNFIPKLSYFTTKVLLIIPTIWAISLLIAYIE